MCHYTLQRTQREARLVLAYTSFDVDIWLQRIHVPFQQESLKFTYLKCKALEQSICYCSIYKKLLTQDKDYYRNSKIGKELIEWKREIA